MDNLPQGFIQQMHELLKDATEDFLSAMGESPFAAIRLNDNKIKSNSALALTEITDDFAKSSNLSGKYDNDKKYCLTPVKWCGSGYYLSDRPNFTLSPLLHAGVYYVQEPAAMIYELICQRLLERGYIDKEAAVLDVCSAPGGKTTSMMNALGEECMVVANEYDPRRAGVLLENLTKWGFPNVIVTQGDTFKFNKLRECFDLMAVDAPCSGEGMMRKDDDAVTQWSEWLVAQCAETQRQILSNVIRCLRPGGVLIYSTCTFNTIENEDIVQWLIDEYGMQPLNLDTEINPGLPMQLKGTAPCIRFMPHLTDGEGQFVAVLLKPGDWNKGRIENDKKRQKDSRHKKSIVSERLLADLRCMIDCRYEDVEIEMVEQKLRACSSVVREYTLKLQRAGIHIISAGVQMGELKGKDMVPYSGFAMNMICNSRNCASVEVDYQTALQYLRHEAIKLPEGTEKGNIIVKYKGFGLGYVKNLGNRANNLYPQMWRIRNL